MRYRGRRFHSTFLFVSCLAVASCAGRRSSNPPQPRVAGPEYEREFLQNRIAHQQAAIEMARSCMQKAVHDELKQFCTSLSSTEAEEARQLQGWLIQWLGISSQPQVQERATQGYRNFLKSVRTSTGSEFEQAFLTALRLHHHEGVRESQACEESAVHPELKSLCSRMIGEQEREIKQISTWICGWFHDCVEK